MPSLRSHLIRLARDHRDLRPHLLPLLKQARGEEFFDASQLKAWRKVIKLVTTYERGRKEEESRLRQKVKGARRYGDPLPGELSQWREQAESFAAQDAKDAKVLVKLLTPLYNHLLKNEGPWTEARAFRDLQDGFKRLDVAAQHKARPSDIRPELAVEDWLYHGSFGISQAIGAAYAIGNLRFEMGLH